MNFKTIFFFMVVVLSLTFSCSSSSADNTDAEGQEEQADATAMTSSKYDVPYPVYEEFSGIEPIFNFQNDSTYIINFWATWCKPCVKELPYFERLHNYLQGKKARIILVSMDFPNQIETRLKTFVEQRNLQPDVMVLTDPAQNDWIPRVEQSWDGAIPVTVVYNAKERKFFSGELDDYDTLKETVESML